MLEIDNGGNIKSGEEGMKERTKTLWIIVNTAVLAVLMLAVFWSGVNTVSVSALISAVIAVILVGFIKWKRTAAGTPESDERTKKLGAYAATYSWLLTLVLIALLFWVDYFSVFKLTVTQALGTTLFVMVLSMNVFRWYFSRKGDIE
jgi:hypothetical protein